METSALGSTAATALKQSDVDSRKLFETLDNFLLMLTTQLENQDPLEPLESSEFTSQIAELSSVEQAINTNKHLEQLVAMNQSSSNVVSYIGKLVEAEGGFSALQNGKATFAYELDYPASELTVSVTTATGQVVHSVLGDKAIGKHVFEWDGTDFNGNTLPDGTYGIIVNATGPDGNDVPHTTYSYGKVTGVNLSGDEPVLELSDTLELPISQVTSVKAPDVSTEPEDDDLF